MKGIMMDRREFIRSMAVVTAGAAVIGATGVPAFAASETGEKGKKMKILVLTGSPRKNGNSATLEGLRGFMRDCMEGTVERGVLYGTGAYEKGEVRNLPVFCEAYEAGKSC